MMNFAEQKYLLALWVLPPLGILCVVIWRIQLRRLRAFASSGIERLMTRQVSLGRFIVKSLLVLIAVGMMVIALARPRWGFDWQKVESTGRNIMIAVDVSKSMLAGDVNPSRLEQAKREIKDLLNRLEGDRVGLIAFAGVAYVQCPLTVDYNTVRMFLDFIEPDLIPVPGTALSMAVELATRSLVDEDNDKLSGGSLVLISDGEDHTEQLNDAISKANEAGIKIFTLGVGQSEGAPIPDEGGGFKKDQAGRVVLTKLNEQPLKTLATATGGYYLPSVAGDGDIEKIYYDGIRNLSEEKEFGTKRRKLWHERFQWFVFVAFIMLLLDSFLPMSRPKTTLSVLVLLIVFGLPQKSVADDLETAEELFRKGEFSQAETIFEKASQKDPGKLQHLYNQAVTQYKQGKFDQARQGFAEAARSEDDSLAQQSYFNLGNSEAMAGNLEGAVSAYKEALKLKPDDKQAKENLRYVEQQLNEQKNKQKESGENSKEEQNKNSSDSSDTENKDGQSKEPDPQKSQDKSENNRSPGSDSEESENRQPQDQQAEQSSENHAQDQDSEQEQAQGNSAQENKELSEQEQPSLSKQQAQKLLRGVEDMADRYLVKPEIQDLKKAQQRKTDKDW